MTLYLTTTTLTNNYNGSYNDQQSTGANYNTPDSYSSTRKNFKKNVYKFIFKTARFLHVNEQ